METFVEKRTRMNQKIQILLNSVYPGVGENEIIRRRVREVLLNFESSPSITKVDVEFVEGILGFFKWREDNKKDSRTDAEALGSILHDFAEWNKNRYEKWFCPRTSSYQQFYKDESLTRLELRVLERIRKSEYMDVVSPEQMINWGVWSFSVTEGDKEFLPNQIKGAMSSLSKKGLISVDDSDGDEVVMMTEKGVQVTVENNLF